VGRNESNPEPYLRLGQSPLTDMTTFARRLRDGRTDALKILLERKGPSRSLDRETIESATETPQRLDLGQTERIAEARGIPGSYVEIIRQQLLEERIGQSTILSTIQIIEYFSKEAQETISVAIVKALENETTEMRVLKPLSPGEIAPVLEAIEEPSQKKILIRHYVSSMIDSNGVRRQRLNMLAEDYGDQLMDTDIQEAFEDAITQAREQSDLNDEEFRRVLDIVNETCPQLYTIQLISNQ
jgi:hypothetical protein